jgi:hypothetical protein
MYVDNVNVFKVQDYLPTIVTDTFNNDITGNAPSNWSVDTTGGTATIQSIPNTADKSLRLSKSGTMNNAGGTRSFTTTSGKVIVQATVRAEETTGY